MDCIRYIKIAIALLNAIFFTVITFMFYAQIQTEIAITSLVCLYIITAVVIFDNSSLIRQLQIQANRLAIENTRLTQTNTSLSANVDRLDEENGKYKALNEQQAKSLNRFDIQLRDSKALIDEYKKQLDTFHDSITKLETINNANDKLIKIQKDNLNNMSIQLDVATNNNLQLSEQVKRFELLNTNLKTIITTMAHSIDQSSNLEAELNTSISKIQSVSHDISKSAEMMNMIINGLSHLKFDQLDLNNDGEISQSEWQKTVLLEY